MTLGTIYKRTESGKTQEWTIEVKGNQYRTISGQTDGKKVVSEWTTVYGKNAGKINETTDAEQAMKEAEAKRKLKLERGYFETLADIDETQYFKPMLAKDWDDEKHRVKFPLYSQPKLDGCLSYDTLVTTDIGDIKIGDIVEKNIDCNVKTYNELTRKTEYKPILNKMKNGIDVTETTTQWYKIETDDGRTIEVTGNHLIYLPKLKCWRRVDELNDGDILLNIF